MAPSSGAIDLGDVNSGTTGNIGVGDALPCNGIGLPCNYDSDCCNTGGVRCCWDGVELRTECTDIALYGGRCPM